MSEDNVETLRTGLDAFNRRDKAAWIANCDPEIENVPPREWPESAPLQGPEAIWEFFVEAQGAWEEGAYEWGEVIEVSSDKLVANQRRQLRGKSSGAGVDWSFWVVTTFRNGTLLRFEWFTDRAEALEASGLSE
jgi:ketosteroid isomerase-like protein